MLQTAADPLGSATWRACLRVALQPCDGDLAAVHALGQDRFIQAARGELAAFGATRICRRIAVAVYAALTDPAGVAAQRPGALERAFAVLGEQKTVRDDLDDVHTRMLQALEVIGVAEVAAATSPERTVVFAQRGSVFKAPAMGLMPGSSTAPQEPAKIS